MNASASIERGILDPFTRAISACIVPVRGGKSGEYKGTAFFVADDRLLTCLHVVDSAATAEILLGAEWLRVGVEKLDVGARADVALLTLARPAEAHRPGIARLGGVVVVHDAVRARGFPIGKAGQAETQVTGTVEDLHARSPDPRWAGGAPVIQVKGAQIGAAMSGAPLVCERTRRVVGIVAATRDAASALGGYATSMRVVLQDVPELAAAQHAIDWSGTGWADVRGTAGPFLERHLDADRPFFGRASEMRALDAWLASDVARALLVVPSGRGKSALVAHWFEHLAASADVIASRTRVELVPLSLSDFASAAEVAGNLERAVANLRGESLLDAAPSVSSAREAFHEGLRRGASDGARLLLIIDALDETKGWEVDENLLPRSFGPGIKVLLTARELKDRDMAGWRRRIGWSPPTPVAEFSLTRIAPPDLQVAVREWWSLAPARVPEYASAIDKLTAGDPLVLSLYLRRFTAHDLPPPQALQDVHAGLEGFFETWWEDQIRQWNAAGTPAYLPATQSTRDVLACANSVIPRRMILAILRKLREFDGGLLDEALRQLSRFIVGTASGYRVSHPELARWWRQKLDADGDGIAIDRAVLALAREMLAQGADPEIRDYLLRSLHVHLARLAPPAVHDLAILAGGAWRALQQNSSDWPQTFTEDLACADRGSTLVDADALRSGSRCAGLPLKAELAARRLSVDRLVERVPASLAARLVRCGEWSSARALQHVLAAYKSDFPRIAALGEIAAELKPADVGIAMSSIATEFGGAFDWDDTLGAWRIAHAAVGAVDIDHARAWAGKLPGIGATTALAGLAAALPGDLRVEVLAQAVGALDSPTHVRVDTLLALASRLADAFEWRDLSAALGSGCTPFDLARHMGFDPAEPADAAAALRIAWKWLPIDAALEMSGKLVRDLDVENLEEYLWFRLEPALGAIWDVCAPEQAREAYRKLEPRLVERSDSRARCIRTVAMRFASRLTPDERRLPPGAPSVFELANNGSSNARETRAMFRAEAQLPERHADLVAGMSRDQSGLVDMLQAAAPALGPDDHAALRATVRRLPLDSRNGALCAVLAGSSDDGLDGVRRAFQHADSVDDGAERQFLERSLDLLEHGSGNGRGQAFLDGLRAVHRSKDEAGLDGFAILTHAASLPPLTFADCAPWIRGDARNRFTCSVLWPCLEAGVIDDLESPHSMPLSCGGAHVPSMLKLLRGIRARQGFAHCHAWVGSMASTQEGEDDGWAELLVQALAPEGGAELRTLAVSIADPQLRAAACASLLGGQPAPMNSEELWAHIAPVLAERDRLFVDPSLARILRRLRGADLERALSLADVDAHLRRAGSSLPSAWVASATLLMPWASRELIGVEFLPRGQLAALDSSTDRNVLRAALAPRLLELGEADIALAIARQTFTFVSSQWRWQTAMVPHLRDPTNATRFAQMVVDSVQPNQSFFAIAGASDFAGLPRTVRHALCTAFCSAASNEPQLFLLLAALAPAFIELSGREALAHLRGALA